MRRPRAHPGAPQVVLWRRWPLVLVASFLLSFPRAALADSYDDEELTLPEPEPPEEDKQAEQTKPEEDKPLSAGGLDAPGAMGDQTEKPGVVEQELQESDERDSGRGLEFAWLTGELGVTAFDASALSGSDFLAAGESTGGAGLSFGGGLGVRVLYFTLGAHVRAAALDPLSLLCVSGGVSFKLPVGNLEPYAALDLGYLSVSGLASGSSASGGLSGVGGFDLRVGLGADYYFSNYFSVGGLLGTDLAFLGRPAYQASDFNGPLDPVYQQSASAVGTAFSASLVVGFHL